MERAIRVVSVERGYDPRQFALVAFGGAGGLHACELAEALGIPRVVVPALPGALSAFGILASDVVKDCSRTVLWRVQQEKLPFERLRREFAAMRLAAERNFRGEGWQGAIRHQYSVDMRYRGQGYELNLPLSRQLREAFEREHQRRYGYRYSNREIELVTLRLRAVVKPPRQQMSSASTTRLDSGSKQTPPPSERALVLFGERKTSTVIQARESLLPGRRYTGPAVITEYSATTVVPPDKRFRVDSGGNLIVEIVR